MVNGNHTLFIAGFLRRISQRFQITEDEAFEVFSISAILDKPFDEVYNEVIIKGRNDGGIDGIYLTKENDDYFIYVFQCKNTRTLKQNEIDKFRNDFQTIFIEGNKVNKGNIEDLAPSIAKYKHVSEVLGHKITPKLFFVFNGDKEEKTNINHLIFNRFQIEGSFEIWDRDDVFQRIDRLLDTNKKSRPYEFIFRPENSNITSRTDNQALVSFLVYEVKAVMFRIDAYQLCEFLETAEKANGSLERVFAENIRGFLGVKNITNQKILETLNSENKIYFPFLNNGITIIAEKFSLPHMAQLGKYPLKVVNPVIINGLQTSYILYQEYKKNKEKLLDVYVTIRLYETQDPTLVELITDATNTQSAINFTDKLSNKKFNVFAKTFFENKGVAYLTKKGETFSNELVRDGAESIRSEVILEKWYQIMFGTTLGEGKIFEATLNPEHDLYPFFSGNIDSPLYSQLYFIFHLDKWLNAHYQNVENKNLFCEIVVSYILEKKEANFNEKTVKEVAETVYEKVFKVKDIQYYNEWKMIFNNFIGRELSISAQINYTKRLELLSQLYINIDF